MYSIAEAHPRMAPEPAPDAASARDHSPTWTFILAMLVYALILAASVNHEALGQWFASLRAAATPAAISPPPAATASATASDADAAEPVANLSAPMKRALDHVARRYRVAPATLLPVFAAAQEAARERGLDPLLIVAVIAVESGFNPIAESPMGAQGLMQVIPRFHKDKVPEDAGEHPFLDPVTNVRIGTHVLQEAIRMRGSLTAGLQQYGGASDPQEAYAARVLAERDRIEQSVAPRLAMAAPRP
jgi:soluble lytic murein transglycosylase-like protein